MVVGLGSCSGVVFDFSYGSAPPQLDCRDPSDHGPSRTHNNTEGPVLSVRPWTVEVSEVPLIPD